ncbi:hypothetical protein V8C42DRAFT_239529 [Trichoderma barbatum]
MTWQSLPFYAYVCACVCCIIVFCSCPRGMFASPCVCRFASASPINQPIQAWPLEHTNISLDTLCRWLFPPCALLNTSLIQETCISPLLEKQETPISIHPSIHPVTHKTQL